jgi:polyribonucleotide nucleotidyltransferase
MLSQPINVTFDIGAGREITIETGKLARQADGAVTFAKAIVSYWLLL